MSDKFIIDADLLQTVVNYIAMGSISKGMSWAELQIVLERLQKLESAEPAKPKLVDKG